MVNYVTMLYLSEDTTVSRKVQRNWWYLVTLIQRPPLDREDDLHLLSEGAGELISSRCC